MTKLSRFLIVILVIFNIFWVAYLLIPVPVIPPLTNAVQSDLPGDTTQLQNVEGFFTDQSRTEVMNFYRAHFTGPFLIHLNYPPEKAQAIFRDTMQSYYIEEFILPFKESLFVNGYEWQNDVFTKPDARIKNKLIYNGIVYQAKINTKVYPTSIPIRLLAFFLTEAGIITIYFLYRSLIKTKK